MGNRTLKNSTKRCYATRTCDIVDKAAKKLEKELVEEYYKSLKK